MSKNIGPLLIIIVIVVAGIVGIFFLSNQKAQNTNDINFTPTIYPTETSQPPTPTPAIIDQQKTASTGANMGNVTTMPDGLQMQDITVGTGAEVKSGDTVTVNYLGTLTNGQNLIAPMIGTNHLQLKLE